MKTRKELYKEIVKNNLQEEVKKVCGKDYTHVKNAELEMILNKTSSKNSAPKTKKNTLEKLIEALEKKRILLPSEVKYITE